VRARADGSHVDDDDDDVDATTTKKRDAEDDGAVPERDGDTKATRHSG
jgi:hypothetical protein